MGWKEFLRDYLTFSRKERIGLLIIIIIVPGIWIFPKLITPVKPKIVSLDSSWIAAAKKLQHKEEDSQNSKLLNENIDELVYDKPAAEYTTNRNTRLFYFDPNNLSFEEWKKLGMREKTIITIQKYV